MARPMKDGISYFSFDVDFLNDIKVRKIKRKYGNDGVIVLISLLANVYRDRGYYMPWDEDTAFVVADEVNVDEDVVASVVDKALEVGMFDQEMYDKHKILTSRGIQKRFLKAAERRKDVKLDQNYCIH